MASLGSIERSIPGALMVLLLAFASACGSAGPKTPAGGATQGITASVDDVVRGGLLAGAIGDSLDPRDRELVAQAYRSGLERSPSGTAATWENRSSGHSGSLLPTRSYENANSLYCREYLETVSLGAESARTYAAACRQPDGRWNVVR